MSQKYIGIKLVAADKDNTTPDNPGYRVLYPQPNGSQYASWAPEEVFENAYFPVQDNYPYLLDDQLSKFIVDVYTEKLGDKTSAVTIKCATGFEITEVSPCLDKADFNHELGVELALNKCYDTLRSYLAFTMCWAKFGLSNGPFEERPEGPDGITGVQDSN